MLIFRTDTLQKVFFPIYVGEKFIPEAYLYDSLVKYGKLFFLDEVLYLCEYQQDGYSSAIHRLNAENPHGYKAYILQRIQLDSNIKYIFGDIIRYISIMIVTKEKFLNSPYLLIKLFLCPLGLFRYLVLYRKYCVQS